MLALPVYLRGSTYYLHTRINGKQFKRSLGTSDKQTAILQALTLLSAIMGTEKKIISVPKITKTYKVDLRSGVFEADGPEDHQRLIELLQNYQEFKKGFDQSYQEVLGILGTSPPNPQGGAVLRAQKNPSLRFRELIDKFFLLKKHLKQATKLSYENVADEISAFLGNPGIQNVQISDITRYLEFIAGKNSSRTLDNKAAVLNTLFNFAIAQGYYFGENPVKNRGLMPKSAKAKSGYAIFQTDEISRIFNNEFLKIAKEKDPDYYWTLILGLFTGCRISEITGLFASQVKKTESGIYYISIDDSKTKAGIREIPLPSSIVEELKNFLGNKKGQIFKYKMRLGKGSGNAVGKKFSRHMEVSDITRDKLVFHSLRKFSNDYFLKSGIAIEPRCQYFGHELENVNVSVYSQKFSVDELAKIVKPAQDGIAKIIGLKFDRN
jgi:integrase